MAGSAPLTRVATNPLLTDAPISPYTQLSDTHNHCHGHHLNLCKGPTGGATNQFIRKCDASFEQEMLYINLSEKKLDKK